jgi:diguanylate cyclase (GGDEF)-like protein
MTVPGTAAAASIDGDDSWLIVLAGEHDVATAALLDGQVRRIPPRCSLVVVDLGAATFIDCSVAAWLIRMRGAVADAGPAELRVVEGPPGRCVQRVLDFVGLRYELPRFPTIEEALADRAGPASTPARPRRRVSAGGLARLFARVARRSHQPAPEPSTPAPRRERDLARVALEAAASTADRAARTAGAVSPALGHRLQAAVDRKKAGDDRARAASDREAAAADRAEALRLRAASLVFLEQATTDELTGARTRFFGLDAAARELERRRRTGAPLTLAFVDVDGLKQINDTRGHLAGDDALRAVGETLRANLRPYDIIIRFGGDEFVCVLSNCNASDAARRFELISHELAMTDACTLSFGLAEAVADDDTLHELIARADGDLLDGRMLSRRPTDVPSNSTHDDERRETSSP